MAKLCMYCGKPLPREDARFCNSCGSWVEAPSNRTNSSQSVMQAAGERPSRPGAGPWPPLNEQIAFPSPPAYLQESPAESPPAWLDQLGKDTTAPAPRRELHMKVWGTPDAPAPTNGQGAGQEVPGFVAPEKGANYGSDLEDLPTSHLNTAPAPRSGRASPPPDSLYNPYQQPFAPPVPDNHSSEIEQLETSPMPTPQLAPAKSVPPVSPIPPVATQHLGARGPVTPALAVSMPGIQPFQRSVPSQPAASRPARRGMGTRLVIMAILLFLVLAGGFAAWIITVHPFEVPAVTSTTVSFQNASLGFSLQYPQGWTAQVDARHGKASFFDANHTDQCNLTAIAKSQFSIDQYIKNAINQLGMTGQKNLQPLTFASHTWQQVRGTVLLSGATFTETLLVTTNGGRLYALLLMAPASTYENADRLFFAPMRASFQFS